MEPTTADRDLFPAPRSKVFQDQGKFRTRFNFPGRNLPDHDDHGYGPLSTVVESFMDPGTLIRMHQHRDEEIVSWVPAGVMRHDDREGNELVTDPEHLLVMNAGAGFWHAEETLADDPPLRMLQIFVRPREFGLEPGIQHGPLPDPEPNEWRRVFAPAGSDHPFTVRNAVDCFDARLDADASAMLPEIEGRDAYVYVFEGSAGVGGDPAADADESTEGVALDKTESVVWTGGGAPPTVTAGEEGATVVAFLIDPDAPVTRQGTIGR
ncbi:MULTISPECIES: pirin family protein [Halorubrum]|uniref:Accessory protein n=1 Tax=Halorubrum hochstenium ATCC 700873 TaxID=1227481 RepID=M0FAS0_9EURY|nr:MULTISPECIES: pirin family protein [Halorubrum]ELZ56438.1 accessory protein [Halorubrum hochstenium ATCC 700873]